MTEGTRYQDIFYRMLLTRYLEEAIVEAARKGNVFGPVHLCIGQEAAGVAACAALKPSDIITTTHRGHAHYIGKGLNLRRLCCEIWGKDEGYGRGRAGHMIVFDRETGVMGGSGIVGGGLPLAVGQALAFQMKKQDRVAAAFFGDGASNTGAFHESLNMAAKWRLPVVFFCENNAYGLTVHVDTHLSVKDVSVRAQAYDIPGEAVFGNDMEAVYTAMTSAVKKARKGQGPSLIEAKTYRMHGFSTTDSGGYQRESELEKWRGKDPIDIGAAFLKAGKIADAAKIKKLKKQAHAEVDDAVTYALGAADPVSIPLPEALFKENNR
jgi:acetoin:2,6-dichlorophenolindophenol oxidoreductase subunit alpha